jgi:hypothetical protein
MGWLGYTERETLNTSIYALEMAIEAHIEKLSLQQGNRFVAALTGSVEPIEPPKPVSGKAVFAAFRSAAKPK